MSKKKFTTSIEEKILDELKIQAVKEHRRVADILDEIIKNYLKTVENSNS